MKHFGIEENSRFSEMAKAVRARRELEERQQEETARVRRELTRTSIEETILLLKQARGALESGPSMIGTPRVHIWARIADALDLAEQERKIYWQATHDAP